jgi:hypothetical protein
MSTPENGSNATESTEAVPVIETYRVGILFKLVLWSNPDRLDDAEREDLEEFVTELLYPEFD